MTPDEALNQLTAVCKAASDAVTERRVPDPDALTYVGVLVQIVAIIDAMDEPARSGLEWLREEVAQQAYNVAREHHRRIETHHLEALFAAPCAEVPPAVG